MKTLILNRFSSLNLRNNHTIKNRVVVPPMASETADTQGLVTEKTLDHYSHLTQSKAGLVLVEYSYIHQSGKSESNQLGIDSDKNIEGLTRLAKVIQSSGALAGIQLTHSGGKSETCFTNGPLQSPSGVVVPVKDKILETPISMDPQLPFPSATFLHHNFIRCLPVKTFHRAVINLKLNLPDRFVADVF